MKNGVTGILVGAGAALCLSACGGKAKQRVYFGNLENGTTVESPFRVSMKSENLIVEPATMGVNPGHGHFHILVDVSPSSGSAPIPKDEKHIHYGDGQTEAVLDLPVGRHKLILEFAGGDHVPYDPPLFQEVTVEVVRRNSVDSSSRKEAAPDSAG